MSVALAAARDAGGWRPAEGGPGARPARQRRRRRRRLITACLPATASTPQARRPRAPSFQPPGATWRSPPVRSTTCWACASSGWASRREGGPGGASCGGRPRRTAQRSHRAAQRAVRAWPRQAGARTRVLAGLAAASGPLSPMPPCIPPCTPGPAAAPQGPGAGDELGDAGAHADAAQEGRRVLQVQGDESRGGRGGLFVGGAGRSRGAVAMQRWRGQRWGVRRRPPAAGRRGRPPPTRRPPAGWAAGPPPQGGGLPTAPPACLPRPARPGTCRCCR